MKARDALSDLEREIARGAPPGVRLVFGAGTPEASLMVVGEAPGRQEELAGLPFVGRAGRLLDTLLAEVGLSRGQLWITNVVKWRPTIASQGRLVTRTPRSDEVAACRAWLEKETAIIGPALLLCLGNLPSRVLVHSGFRMNREHGRWHHCRPGTETMATFHPAYALRRGGVNGPVWCLMLADFSAVKSRHDRLDVARKRLPRPQGPIAGPR